MASDRNSYGNILKAIGLFGGVKVFQIIVGVIKNKCVALLLGPAGMGIVGLITSTTSMISAFTGFGLSTSTVRDISAAYTSNDSNRIGRVVAILRKLVWGTGILGALLTVILANQLSLWAFGNNDYATAFRILSIIILLDQLTIGQTALMQGTFHYRYMAKAALYGSILGLFVSIPLYYEWGEKAIVPVILLSSLTAYLLAFFYARKISLPQARINFHDIITDGKTMMVMGTVLALTSAFRLGGTYIQRLFISNIGSVADVGLYVAGSAIATQYIDLILGGMTTDYTPRLSAITEEKDFIDVINRQLKLMVTLVTPLIIVFVLFARELIILLYSGKFVGVISMIEWMMFAMYFRVISWCLSFAFIAKGESKAFFWNESLCIIYGSFFSIVGYYWAGFLGLGGSFLAGYLCYTVQMYILGRKLFNFEFNKDCLLLVLKQFILLVIAFALIEIFAGSVWRYILGLISLVVISYVSYLDFNKMIPVGMLIQNFKSKAFHKD